MITPQLKDVILNAFTDKGTFVSFNIKALSNDFNINKDVLELIIDQFQNHNLMTLQKMLGGRVDAYLTADAFDLVRLGGYTAREDILKLNIQKLQLEIDSLQESFPEKAETISTILGNIASVVPLLFSNL